jgi:hypothetical protein
MQNYKQPDSFQAFGDYLLNLPLHYVIAMYFDKLHKLYSYNHNFPLLFWFPDQLKSLWVLILCLLAYMMRLQIGRMNKWIFHAPLRVFTGTRGG